jgi:hypothetical protein
MPGAYNVFAVNPNPVTQSATISFSLNKPSHVTFTIADAKGSILKIITDKDFSEGTHTANFNRGSLAAGIYYLQLKNNNGITMKKIIIE